MTINTIPKEARFYVNKKLLGIGEIFELLNVGVDHEYRVDCDLYHIISGKILTNTNKKTNLDINLEPAFGFLSIDTKSEQGAEILINGKHAGITPYVSEKLASGLYEVQVFKSMYKTATKSIRVIDDHTNEYVFDQASNFAELHFKTDPEAQLFIDGQLKSFGWFISLMSGIDFKGFSTDMTSDSEDGRIDGELLFYSGETSNIRFSLIAGGLIKLKNNIVLRFGLGYGIGKLSWKTTDEQWVNMQKYSVTGLEISAGLHYSIKDFIVSFDIVSTQFKKAEVKLGLGIKFNNKK